MISLTYLASFFLRQLHALPLPVHQTRVNLEFVLLFFCCFFLFHVSNLIVFEDCNINILFYYDIVDVHQTHTSTQTDNCPMFTFQIFSSSSAIHFQYEVIIGKMICPRRHYRLMAGVCIAHAGHHHHSFIGAWLLLNSILYI